MAEEPIVLTLTSFSKHGDERVRSILVPTTYTGQQSLSFAGWDITFYEDGEMQIARDSAVTDAVAITPKALTVGDTAYNVTLKPYVPEPWR